MTTSLERILLTRDIVMRTEFPHVIMFPRDLSNAEASEIVEWLEANCKGRFSLRNIRNTYSMRFADDEDFMLFSMRWL